MVFKKCHSVVFVLLVCLIISRADVPLIVASNVEHTPITTVKPSTEGSSIFISKLTPTPDVVTPLSSTSPLISKDQSTTIVSQPTSKSTEAASSTTVKNTVVTDIIPSVSPSTVPSDPDTIPPDTKPTTATPPTTSSTVTTPPTTVTPKTSTVTTPKTQPTSTGTPSTSSTGTPPTSSTVPTTKHVTTPIPVTTSAPEPHHQRQFDGPSFMGGIVLASGLMAIGFVAFKFYKARTERNYHTL